MIDTLAPRSLTHSFFHSLLYTCELICVDWLAGPCWRRTADELRELKERPSIPSALHRITHPTPPHPNSPLTHLHPSQAAGVIKNVL